MGKVYLLGAGPGDPELLTIKGLRILREADVILPECRFVASKPHGSKPVPDIHRRSPWFGDVQIKMSRC